MVVPSFGFVLYCPKTETLMEAVFYNDFAWDILSFLTFPKAKKKKISYAGVCSICAKWKKLLDKRLNTLPGDCKKENREGNIIDTIYSQRRGYVVRGNVLYGESFSLDSKGRNQILFTLERMQTGILNLPKIFRQWKLSRREQEVVQLLISDRSNKEMARDLNLSINTVKSYMKFLMRKLNVGTRSGVIGKLLANS